MRRTYSSEINSDLHDNEAIIRDGFLASAIMAIAIVTITDRYGDIQVVAKEKRMHGIV